MRALTAAAWAVALAGLVVGCKEPKTVDNTSTITLSLGECLGPPAAAGGADRCGALLDEAAPEGEVNACLLLQKQGMTPETFRVPMRWADSDLVPVAQTLPPINPGESYAAELYLLTTAGDRAACDGQAFGEACGDGCLVKLSQAVRQVGRDSDVMQGEMGPPQGSGNTLDFTQGGTCQIEQGPAAVEQFAAAEICDQIDNDCDGQVDEFTNGDYPCAEQCDTDANCADTPDFPVCVGGRCTVCRVEDGDGATHDGCGPQQLCCDAGEGPACVDTTPGQCSQCGAAGACGTDADACVDRACGCAANGNATCDADAPWCTADGCVECRTNTDAADTPVDDCDAGELCCGNRCIPQSLSDCAACGQGCGFGLANSCTDRTCQCGANAECGDGQVCDSERQTCVGCLQDADCGGDTPLCVDQRCVECDINSLEPQCVADANRPICNAQGQCAGCNADAQCELRADGRGQCVMGVCLECDPDDNNVGCGDLQPICDMGICRGCMNSAECGPGSECTDGLCTGCNPVTQVGCEQRPAVDYCDPALGECRACESDDECGETEDGNGDQCVEGQCEICDPADHAGCGADELCCVGGDGVPGCVATEFAGGCEACGVACNPDLSNVCDGRSCECANDDRACNPGAELCEVAVSGGTCQECRNNGDCPLDRLCCDGACVPTGPGEADRCFTCDAVVGIGACDPLSTNLCDDRECKCGQNAPCANDTDVCDDARGVCVQCRGDGDCGRRPGTPECVNNTCLECDRADGHRGCAEDSATPICNGGTCERCFEDAECLGRPGTRDECVNQRCEACDPTTNPQVTNNEQPADGCDPGQPICDGQSRTCRACGVDAECGQGQECVNGQCSRCDPNDFDTCGGIGSLNPVCDPQSEVCRGCRADAECPDGFICTEGDGRCVECALGTHEACGVNQLCCGALGEQACVATNMGRCASCDGAGSACDPDATNRCVRRNCTCGPFNPDEDDNSCGGFTPFCGGDDLNGQCVSCRDNDDCQGLGARTRCVRSNPGDAEDLSASCEVCDPVSNIGCDNTRTQPICRISGGVSCTGCDNDGECAARGPNGRDQCVTNGSCQVCDPVDDAGCGDAASPICDEGSFSCRVCRADIECQLNPSRGDLCDEGSGVCFACDDGARNGTETGRDCGGDCRAFGQLCPNDGGCAIAADCQSGVCTGGRCRAPTCEDGVFNGVETDEDCGGAACRGSDDLCQAGQQCDIDGDCRSDRCVDGRCGEASCADGVENGNETDVDCGGDCRLPPLLLTCEDGQGCGNNAANCASGVCTNGSCQQPACDDNVRNGLETDTDCGGANMCARCAVGGACVGGGDCQTGVCQDGTCQMPTCNDGVLNGDETDIDCGGDTCNACRAGELCQVAGDCVTGECDNGTCADAQCDDTILNGDETDTDCGGPACAPCADGDACAGADSNCVSGVCRNNTCQAPTCIDNTANGAETDVDCGGGTCNVCQTGEGCAAGTDCVEKVCQAGTCAAPTCVDGERNGDEPDVDCGGPACRAENRLCADLADCDIAGDCQSGVCSGGTCRVPTCNDNVQNADETDTDCGGDACRATDKCADGDGCGVAGDCQSGVCTNGTCQPPACDDTVRNGTETDTDCGGDCPQPCADGAGCGDDGDCTSGVCNGNVCQVPTCNDNTTNGAETDEDCGGAQCRAEGELCANNAGCQVGADCGSGVCDNNICQAPACDDAIQNGNETDVDCGGGSCRNVNKCDDGEGCGRNSDCVSGVCANNTCQAPACDDGVENGTEKGEDCGGGCPTGCPDGTACDVANDCASQVCDVTCQQPTCDDGVQNDDETDTDCGGSCGATCGPNEVCLDDSDCATGLCDEGTCAPLCANGILDAANGETDIDCGGANCAPCGLGQTCDGDDGNCGAAAPQCVNNQCEVCDPANQDGCGNNQLCCDGGGAPACQNTDTDACTACQGGACDADTANQCVGRTCQCGDEAACDPGGATPYCLVDGVDTGCVACRDNNDCVAPQQCDANNECAAPGGGG